MASMITLKRRIKSITGTRQITKAMELVAASKLRHAQTQAETGRDYREAAYKLLARLNTIAEVERQPLFKKRKVKTKLYVVITSTSGLAGAYNANVLKLLSQSIVEDKENHIRSQVITIGSKGAQFVQRLKDVDLVAVYPAFGDKPTANDIRPILNYLVDEYRSEKIDEVRLFYTVFNSTISQKASNLALLPAKLEEKEAPQDEFSMNFEPSVETVIHQIGTRLIESQIWQALLESLASEQAMRMLAMKNATDNASDLIDDYNLEYNTARQASITQELAEITGGVEALA